MNSYRNLLLCLTLLLPLRIGAQSYTPQQPELSERLISLVQNSPQELAYIQTNKDIYETGEDLWFKVYLLDAQYLTPSPLSKTLYLQLVNETSKKEVWQEKYEIQNGFSNGQVFLDNKLPEGEYLLEAFTPNTFFNDSSEFHAIRRVMIKKDINTLAPLPPGPVIIAPRDKKENKIQFTTFPEGGNLVSGIESNLAFKAVNRTGEPVMSSPKWSPGKERGDAVRVSFIIMLNFEL